MSARRPYCQFDVLRLLRGYANDGVAVTVAVIYYERQLQYTGAVAGCTPTATGPYVITLFGIGDNDTTQAGVRTAAREPVNAIGTPQAELAERYPTVAETDGSLAASRTRYPVLREGPRVVPLNAREAKAVAYACTPAFVPINAVPVTVDEASYALCRTVGLRLENVGSQRIYAFTALDLGPRTTRNVADATANLERWMRLPVT